MLSLHTFVVSCKFFLSVSTGEQFFSFLRGLSPDFLAIRKQTADFHIFLFCNDLLGLAPSIVFIISMLHFICGPDESNRMSCL